MVGSVSASLSPFPQTQPFSANTAATTGAPAQTSARLQTQIAQQVARAPAGANVDVQYRYGTGPNGQLVVTSAVVSVTESVPLPERFGGPGNTPPSSAVRDVVDISSAASQQEEVGLNAAQREVVRRLQASDAAVRRHEALHFRAAGGLASLPTFQTVTGPDGRQYAVAGSVAFSAPTGNSETTAPQEETRPTQEPGSVVDLVI